MMESWRTARDRARKRLDKARAVGLILRSVQVQEAVPLNDLIPQDLDGALFIADVQELEADEIAYHQVVREYKAWATKQGNLMWQQKVKAAQDSVSKAVDQGWSLQPVGEYRKGSERVSAFEATGGKGGAVNVKSGYSYVEIKPGLMNELEKDLQKWGYSGYQLERLARTEYTRAMNDGLLSIYQEDEMVVAYEWSAIADFRTCVECAMMNGVVMDRDDARLAFYEPPLHCNCRCELLPVFAWEMREPDFDKQREVTLFDKNEKPFSLTYIPNRIDPDFLKSIRIGDDATAIKRQLITKKQAEGLRNGFVPPTPEDRFGAWVHPRSEAAAARIADEIRGSK